MSQSRRHTGKGLLYGGLIALSGAAAWGLASYIDLQDGSTWDQTPRHQRPPLYERVEAHLDPSRFKAIVVLRGLMPVVFFGTFAVSLLLGAAAREHASRS